MVLNPIKHYKQMFCKVNEQKDFKHQLIISSKLSHEKWQRTFYISLVYNIIPQIFECHQFNIFYRISVGSNLCEKNSFFCYNIPNKSFFLKLKDIYSF